MNRRNEGCVTENNISSNHDVGFDCTCLHLQQEQQWVASVVQDRVKEVAAATGSWIDKVVVASTFRVSFLLQMRAKGGVGVMGLSPVPSSST